jgi:peptide deformylase
MATLQIKRLPNKVLRKKADPVKKITGSEIQILSDMAETMYINSGVGLAAPQVGIDKQLAVIDIGNGLLKMINPCIIKCEGKECKEEGCLSVPDVSVRVTRSAKVTVEFLNENGEVVRMSADGLFARAIQHELDHLNGKLIVDYLGPIRKLLLRKKVK